MGKSARERRKRTVAQAHRDIILAIGHLQKLEVEFTPVHPELGEALQAMCVGLDVCNDLLEKFCIPVFGGIPGDWESWRNQQLEKYKDPDGETN